MKVLMGKQTVEFVRCAGCHAQVHSLGLASEETAHMRAWCQSCTAIREAMSTFPYHIAEGFPDHRAMVLDR